MRRSTALFAMLFLPVLALAQPQAPGWESARNAIVKDYARTQPKDKLIEVSGPERREVVLIAVRYYGSAVIEREDGTRDRDRVLVEYRLVGETWELARVHVYESQALSEMPPPTAAEAQRLFAAAWPKDKCEGYDIGAVAIDGEPRFQREITSDRASAKRWYVYRLKIAARGNGKFRMSEDGASYENATQNLLLWNPRERSWSVDPRQLRCSGFVKLKN
jgi:hypothetical protein